MAEQVFTQRLAAATTDLLVDKALDQLAKRAFVS
jgi:hypothetical protein